MTVTPRRRDGVGLLAIIVFVALVTAVLLVSVPALIRFDRINRVVRTAHILVDLDSLINDQTAALDDFNQRVGRNPSRLTQLTTPITVTDRNACNTATETFTAAQVNNWVTFGPFGPYVATTSGLNTPIGMANNLLERTPATGGAGTIALVFPGIDSEDAIALDAYMDAANGFNTGVVQWTAPAADGSTTMRWFSPVQATC